MLTLIASVGNPTSPVSCPAGLSVLGVFLRVTWRPRERKDGSRGPPKTRVLSPAKARRGLDCSAARPPGEPTLQQGDPRVAFDTHQRRRQLARTTAGDFKLSSPEAQKRRSAADAAPPLPQGPTSALATAHGPQPRAFSGESTPSPAANERRRSPNASQAKCRRSRRSASSWPTACSTRS